MCTVCASSTSAARVNSEQYYLCSTAANTSTTTRRRHSHPRRCVLTLHTLMPRLAAGREVHHPGRRPVLLGHALRMRRRRRHRHPRHCTAVRRRAGWAQAPAVRDCCGAVCPVVPVPGHFKPQDIWQHQGRHLMPPPPRSRCGRCVAALCVVTLVSSHQTPPQVWCGELGLGALAGTLAASHRLDCAPAVS